MSKPIKQALIFILLVLGFSYFVFWGPIAVLKLKTINLVEGQTYDPIALIFYITGGFVPSILGIVLTAIYEGRQGVKQLLRSAVNFKIGFRSLLVIFGYILLINIGLLILNSLSVARFDFSLFLTQWPSVIALFFLGPVSEEFGWRGFLQKRLNGVFSSPIVVSLIIGVIWSLWHLPLFYIIGTPQHDYNSPFLPFMVAITAVSFVMTCIYSKSKGSLFSAILFHWVFSYCTQVVATGISRTPSYTNVEFIPALIVIAFVIVMMLKEKSKNTQNLRVQQGV